MLTGRGDLFLRMASRADQNKYKETTSGITTDVYTDIESDQKLRGDTQITSRRNTSGIVATMRRKRA
jgi:hypothetical protein